MSLPARRRHFPLSGKSLFFIVGFSEHTFSSTTAPSLTGLQLHSHTSELSETSTVVHRASLLQQLEVWCFAQGHRDTDCLQLCNLSVFLLGWGASIFARDSRILHISAQLLTNPMNYLLPCYDVSCFIISIIGFCTQQAELRQTRRRDSAANTALP